MLNRFALLATLVLAACGSDPKVVPCQTDANCSLRTGGQCIASPAGFDQCAYPAAQCPSQMAYGDLSGDLSGTCAAAAFDVAFVDEWRFSIAAPAIPGGVIQIINTSGAPLSLSTLAVTVTDDHPTAQVGVTLSQDAGVRAMSLAPGTATQAVTLPGAPLATEPVADSRDVFSFDLSGLTGALTSTFDIKATVTVTLDGASVALPMTLHMVSGLDPVIVADAEGGARVAAFH